MNYTNKIDKQQQCYLAESLLYHFAMSTDVDELFNGRRLIQVKYHLVKTES